MYRNFAEVERYILEHKIVKRIALCGAHDLPALSAVVDAKRKGLVTGILIGVSSEIRDLLTKLGEDYDDYEIINIPDEAEAAAKAVEMVRFSEADIPMKGLMQTSSFMRAILNKETGLLPPGKILSQCTVFEYPDQNRLMFATDCAVNITPGFEEKKQLIANAVELARYFGIETPKVAVLSAVEKFNPKIPSTVEAMELANQTWDNCIVEGPFALDNAVDQEAAEHKGITGNVAGQADILLMPDLCAGNVFHKALHFFAHLKSGSALCGTEQPVIMTSRTDTAEAKYLSILTAILQSL